MIFNAFSRFLQERIDPYAITVRNIPVHISLPYVQSEFMGCVYHNEQLTAGRFCLLERSVHFYFRNVDDSMGAYKKVFKLPLGPKRIVCFRRINIDSTRTSRTLNVSPYSDLTDRSRNSEVLPENRSDTEDSSQPN